MKKARTSEKGSLRPPIVTVLGHVDHGKTTLLDYIRKTNVVRKEAGGITQSIGASVVTTSAGKKITFIDTPGHAAFSKMRSRGAKVADIAILAVAAHGGIKPQTKEALNFIKDADIPYIVAATKVDLPSALAEAVRAQLEKERVRFEGHGGDVPFVPVSGKTGQGVDELLEMVTLVSEVNEIKGDPDGKLDAVVIETDKDKRGTLTSVVLTNGTLKIGDEISASGIIAKVRGLFDDKGKPVKEVKPGEPALILGFSELPPIGSPITYQRGKSKLLQKEQKKPPKEIKEGQVPVVVKAASAGSLEAILSNLPGEVVVVSSGVGDVNESDVFFAKSVAPARIFAFESKVSSSVSRLTRTEGVAIERFDVIYELFDRLSELVKEGQTEILGKAEILASFPFNKRKVAGSKVLEGRISKSDNLVIMRGDKKLGEVKITSMKKEKQNIEQAKAGEEFGIIFQPQLDFEVGDMVVSVRK